MPHGDEGYGFTEAAVHRFSRSGTALVITVDNGINTAGPVRLVKRLGIDVVIIDHHQIETRAEAIWSDQFCAAGLGLMVSWALLGANGIAGGEIRDVPGEPQPAGCDRLHCRLRAVGGRDPDPHQDRLG